MNSNILLSAVLKSLMHVGAEYDEKIDDVTKYRFDYTQKEKKQRRLPELSDECQRCIDNDVEN